MISDDLTVIREIINCDDSFFKLCDEYRKQSVTFLMNADDFVKDERCQSMKKFIDCETIFELHKTFRGMTVYFPESIIHERINEQIYEDYLGGYDYKQLARKYGRTIDNIRKICKRFIRKNREEIDGI